MGNEYWKEKYRGAYILKPDFVLIVGCAYQNVRQNSFIRNSHMERRKFYLIS